MCIECNEKKKSSGRREYSGENEEAMKVTPKKNFFEGAVRFNKVYKAIKIVCKMAEGNAESDVVKEDEIDN